MTVAIYVTLTYNLLVTKYRGVMLFKFEMRSIRSIYRDLLMHMKVCISKIKGNREKI